MLVTGLKGRYCLCFASVLILSLEIHYTLWEWSSSFTIFRACSISYTLIFQSHSSRIIENLSPPFIFEIFSRLSRRSALVLVLMWKMSLFANCRDIVCIRWSVHVTSSLVPESILSTMYLMLAERLPSIRNLKEIYYGLRWIEIQRISNIY